MSPRRAAAAATLAGLGLDVEAVEAGRVAAASLVPRLAEPGADALIAALAELAHPAAAALLVALEGAAPDRAVRKDIRRALYRLRQRGVIAPGPIPAGAPPLRAAEPAAEGFVSHADARGDRLVWIVRPLVEGGALVVAAQINEPGGLRDVQLGETTRKQLRAARRELEQELGTRLVSADWRVLDALIVEAQARAGSGERSRDYLRLRPRLTTDPPLAPAEPVSAHVAPPEAEEAAELAVGSERLLAEPELQGWGSDAEAARPFVEEIATMRQSPLVVSRVAQEERVRDVLRRAAEALVPPPVLARRLEATAYVLAETGRAPAARQALAVARLLREARGAPIELPFVAALTERAVGGLLAERTAREAEAERESLVVTPAQVLRDRSSSRPRHTRG